MYSRKMFQSSKQRVLEVTWGRCCDLAWKASRRSLHRDHTSVLARDVQGAKATPNRGRGRQGAQARKNWPRQFHENSQCFVTFQKELKMSGCKSEKKSGCISDPHAVKDCGVGAVCHRWLACKISSSMRIRKGAQLKESYACVFHNFSKFCRLVRWNSLDCSRIEQPSNQPI